MTTGLDRRTFVRAAAWSVPVVATATMAPLAAASGQDAWAFAPSVPVARLENDFTGTLSYTANVFYTTALADDPPTALFTWTLTLRNIYDDATPVLPIASGSQEIAKGDTWATSGEFDTTGVPRGYYTVALEVVSARTVTGGQGIRILAPLAGLRPAADDITIDFTATSGNDQIDPDMNYVDYTVTVGYTGADADRAYTVPWTLTLQPQGGGAAVQLAASDAVAAVNGPYIHQNTYRPTIALTPGTYVVTGVAEGSDRTVVAQKALTVS